MGALSRQGKRRALGQHFLKDVGVANQMAEVALEEAAAHQCRGLLEIGPGKGALTHPLLKLISNYPSVKSLMLVERDEELGKHWQQSSVPGQVKIADFLDLMPEEFLQFAPVAVISNLPYSSGTAILKKLAGYRDRIPVMVLMFQAEVAKRLRAETETRDRGSLSVWIQNLWDVRKFLSVPAKAFHPAPKVQSEIVILNRRMEPRVPGTLEGEALWDKLLKGSFAQRRKMLRSAFPWKNALEQSGVDGRKRPEALQWHEWESLFQILSQSLKSSPEF